MKGTRIAGLAATILLAWAVVFAGEYSTFDWLKLRRELALERRALDDLHVVLDSLGRLAHETNGDYYRFHASFVTPLKQIEKRTVGYYMISYHPQQPKRGYQSVRVTLKNPEFRVYARAGYSTTD